jgi:hypothetical protein
MADEKEKATEKDHATIIPAGRRNEELSDEDAAKVTGGIAGRPSSGAGE